MTLRFCCDAVCYEFPSELMLLVLRTCSLITMGRSNGAIEDAQANVGCATFVIVIGDLNERLTMYCRDVHGGVPAHVYVRLRVAR